MDIPDGSHHPQQLALDLFVGQLRDGSQERIHGIDEGLPLLRIKGGIVENNLRLPIQPRLILDEEIGIAEIGMLRQVFFRQEQDVLLPAMLPPACVPGSVAVKITGKGCWSRLRDRRSGLRSRGCLTAAQQHQGQDQTEYSLFHWYHLVWMIPYFPESCQPQASF